MHRFRTDRESEHGGSDLERVWRRALEPERHTAAIFEITDRIEVVIEPFRGFRTLIASIPGIGPPTADVIVAEPRC